MNEATARKQAAVEAVLVQAVQAVVVDMKRVHGYKKDEIYHADIRRWWKALDHALSNPSPAAQALLEELEQERSINATSVRAAGNYLKQIESLQAELREAKSVNARLHQGGE